MKIDKLKAGMIVYDVHKTRIGNTTMRTYGEWPVRIIEVGPNFVIAEWNNNPPIRFFRFPWKLKRTVFVKVGSFGKRPATRAELKAMKEAECAQ